MTSAPTIGHHLSRWYWSTPVVTSDANEAKQAREEGDTSPVLRRLVSATKRLRLLSALTTVATLMQLGLALLQLAGFGPFGFQVFFESSRELVACLGFLLLAVALQAILGFDRALSHGNAAFQVLSDEYERPGPRGDPTPTTRMALRDFVAASSLPLVKGSGTAVFAAANIALSVITMFSLRFPPF
jgi:hypothetical protein